MGAMFENVYAWCYVRYLLRTDYLLRAMLERLENPRVIYDIGASKGWYSRALSKSYKAKIYAFEPSPVSFRHLLRHLTDWHLNGVEAVPCALSDQDGEADYFMARPEEKSSFDRAESLSGGGHIVSHVKVQRRTIDALVQGKLFDPPDVIKVDTEGHEYQVLKGAEQTIKQFKPFIFYEPHAYGSKDCSQQEARIQKLLEPFDYSFTKLPYGVCCLPNKAS